MPVKIVVKKHPEGYVAYPAGLKGVVVGQGDTYEDALADALSAIRFHIKTFGEREIFRVEGILKNRKNTYLLKNINHVEPHKPVIGHDFIARRAVIPHFSISDG